jgi:hypothetical protein
LIRCMYGMKLKNELKSLSTIFGFNTCPTMIVVAFCFNSMQYVYKIRHMLVNHVSKYHEKIVKCLMQLTLVVACTSKPCYS